MAVRISPRTLSVKGGPKISVLMPAYNAAPYIEEAIRSVLAQRGVMFELLIGDDASTDETWQRIQMFSVDPRIRAWKFERRSGSAAVWNRLIPRARGRYLSICDADDRLLPGNLRILSRVLDRSPRIGVVCAEWKYMNSKGRLLQRRRRLPCIADTWDLVRMGWTHGGSMFRRSVIEQIGGYREAASYAEATDLLLRLAEVTRFATLPGKAYYRYRVHPYPVGFMTRRNRLVGVAIREAIRRRYGVRVRW